ncbi:MAG: ribose-phosphate pyrophosphokinase [Candidatus Deianiraeaceae bacterium]|jgi:ribose-phosphate pyrophosphokinase
MQKVFLSNGQCLSSNADDYCPTLTSFSDGEISINLDGLELSKKSFLVIQSLFGSHQNIIELLLSIDVISRNSSAPIHLLIPYLCYSRQDREISQYAPFSGKVIADLLSHKSISTISIVDLHSPQIQGFFQKPCFNILLESFILEHICANYNMQDIAICAADIGGAKFARKIADNLSVESITVEKTRSSAGVSQAVSVVGKPQNKICIIVDDMIDTAGTLCNASDILMKNGAKAVVAYATHGIFSGNALPKINNSSLQNIFVSNTITHASYPSKIIQLNVSDFIINAAIKRIKEF